MNTLYFQYSNSHYKNIIIEEITTSVKTFFYWIGAHDYIIATTQQTHYAIMTLLLRQNDVILT